MFEIEKLSNVIKLIANFELQEEKFLKFKGSKYIE